MVNTSVKHRGKLQALSSVDGSIFFVSRLALVLSAVWAVIYLGAGKHAISFIAAGVGIGSLISTLLSANEKYASAKHVFFITTFVGVLASTLVLPPESHINWFQICIASGAILTFGERRDRGKMTFYVMLAGIGMLSPYVLPRIELSSDVVSPEFAKAYVAPFVGATLFFLMSYLAFWFNAAVRSQIKKLDIARKSAQELAAAKSDFLATMSHELRTPMNGVVGMVDLLLQGEMRPEQRRMMETVQESSRELLYVIDDLVDASGMEAGRLSPRSEPVNIREVLSDSVEAMRPLAETNGIPLMLKIDEQLPACVMGDANRLRQVVMNLLHNAVKFSDGIAAHRNNAVTLSAENSDDEMLVLCVEDHGIGMSADMIQRLFRPFVQREGVQSRRFGGMGLGLAISHRLVHLMGGTIFVESKLGYGSRFYIQLPLKEVKREGVLIKRQPVSRPQLPSISLGTCKILVVEDNKINRLVIQQQLVALGCEADLATNGYDGLQRWRAGDYDLVLSDCHMPEMNGMEMSAHIRAEEHEKGLKRIPIIAITASAQPQQEVDCRAAGMDDFLTKPVRLEELAETLGNWVGIDPLKQPEAVEAASDNVLAFSKRI